MVNTGASGRTNPQTAGSYVAGHTDTNTHSHTHTQIQMGILAGTEAGLVSRNAINGGREGEKK